MRIRNFKYHEPTSEGWTLDPIALTPHINLLVGESGAGKTRLLNMLFNISSFVATNQSFCPGVWSMHFEHDGVSYVWEYSGFVDSEDEGVIQSEKFWIGDLSKIDNLILDRDLKTTKFNGVVVPTLPKGTSALHAFREDESLVAPCDAFRKIKRRNFFGQDLAHAVSLQSAPIGLIKRLGKSKKIEDLFFAPLTLNSLMHILEIHFPKKFAAIVEQFQIAFPNIESMYTKGASELYNVQHTGNAAVLLLKERNVEKPIPLSEISSGMQKVLLILADVIASPSNSLYMIDEYENSLGINAINFLPSFLAEFGEDRQFILTTHHPLLINAIPVSSWFVFHRDGVHISVKFGAELEEKYGKSKQQRFTQLLNDPFYSRGIN